MSNNVHNALANVKSKRTHFLCDMHDMDYDDRPDSAKRLEEARKKRGFKTAGDAARYFGWSKDSYIQHENGTRGLSRAAEKYAKAYRVKEAWLLAIEDDSGAPDSDTTSAGLEVVGKIEAGNFRDITLDLQDGEFRRIPIGRDPRFPHARQYALEVSGDSMNERFPDGSFVTCVDFGESGMELKAGMTIHVERMIAGKQLVETTLKEVQFSGSKVKLVPRSTNPKHKPFILNGGEDTEIVVRGVVTGKWQPEAL